MTTPTIGSCSLLVAYSVVETDAGIDQDPDRAGQRARLVRQRGVEHVPLGDLVMLFAKRRRRVQRVVDDHAEHSARLEGQREHVDALGGERPAHAAQRAGVVRELQREFGSNRHAVNVRLLGETRKPHPRIDFSRRLA